MQNPKYAKVKSTINTGATAKNAPVYSKSAHSNARCNKLFLTTSDGNHVYVLTLSPNHPLENDVGDQMIAKRRNERFKRIKGSTLARLLRESLAEESIYQLGRDGTDIQASDSVSQRGGIPINIGAAAG